MPKKILIVDDEADQRTFLSTVLEENGYTSIGAKDGVEGLELLGQEKPDLVLLDLMMPKKSGISMFQELRSDPNLSHIPVVVVTSSIAEEDMYRADQLNCNHFVMKPIDQDDLVETVGKIDHFGLSIVTMPPADQEGTSP